MTFAEFKAAVLENLGPDGQRAGTGTSGLEAFRDRAVLNAMIDVQRLVPAFRVGNTSSFTHAQLTADGRASRGAFAAGARPREFWIHDATDTCKRYRLDSFPWAERDALICGNVPDARYHYSIAPNARTYLIHPGLTTATKLELVWDGIKTIYADADVLAEIWDTKAAECVAEYVKWKIVHNYDKDAVSRARRHEEEYIRLRRGLYLDAKEVTNA